MEDQTSHSFSCSCTNCYSRKTLPAFFVVIFDFLFALGSTTAIILCTHFHNVVFDYCPRSVSNDILTQSLVSISFFAASIFLFVGIVYKLAWTMGMHILKDGLYLIISFILLIVNIVTVARSGTFTLYDGAVLGSIAVFAALHAWFILVMVSVGNHILANNKLNDRRYSPVYDMEKHDSDVYL